MKEFVREIRELQQRDLATSWSEADVETRAGELPDELTESLNSAARFEIEVRNHDGKSDPNEIFEEQTTFVPWGPKYLSADGTTHYGTEGATFPADRTFRVAFYIHDWPVSGNLVGPAGVLPIPAFAPVPERLWSLAPYALLD